MVVFLLYMHRVVYCTENIIVEVDSRANGDPNKGNAPWDLTDNQRSAIKK